MLETSAQNSGNNDQAVASNLQSISVAEGQTCSLNVSASDILSVSKIDGNFVITLKDGTQTAVATPSDSSSVSFELSSGEIYTSQDMAAMFAMGTPEDLYDTGVQDANYQSAYQEQQAQDNAHKDNQNGQQQDADTQADGENDPSVMDQLAQDLADVETAAGDEGGSGSSSSGSGFNSSFESQSVEGLNDVGALGQTELQYGVGNQQDDNCGCEAPDLNPKLAIDAEQQVYEDGSIQVMLTAVPDSSNGVMTITIVGIPATWTVTGQGSYNATTMTWTFTTAPGQSFHGGPTLTPPADSDVDLNDLRVTVAEFDSATGQHGVTFTTIDVIVDAVADTPTIQGENTHGLEDTSVDVHITGAPGDKDGSEVIQKFVVSGVPEGFSLNHGHDTGNGVWELTAQDVQGLKLTGPNNFYGEVPLQVTIHTAETVTDRDFDLTNNTAEASTQVTVSFIPVADPPLVTIDLPHGSDCGCPGHDGLVAQVYEDNKIDVNFHALHDATATPNETMTVTVSGVDLTKLEAGTFTITGIGNAVWERVPGSPDNNASFTISLAGGVDYNGSMHFVPKPNSDIDLHDITVTATAHEPASDTSASAVPQDFDVVVDAVADKPAIQVADISVDDDGAPANIVIHSNVTDTDGSEHITHYQISGVPNGFNFNHGTNLGNGIWQFQPAQIDGLKLNPPNVDYEGKISLKITVFNVDTPTDKDFDTTNNHNSNCDTFTVEWADDEPVAVKDFLGTAYDCAPGSHTYDAYYQGNLIQGTGYTETLINGQPWSGGQDATHSRKDINTGGKDILGKDAVTLTSFTFEGQTAHLTNGGHASITGYDGHVTVTLYSDGRYEILSDRVGSYSFEYTITDSDGDCSSAGACFNTSQSPLVLDLDNNGIDLTNAENGVLFDMNNDGQLDKTGWVGPHDGLLAIDSNHDGIINNQSELFGNTSTYEDGFANLAQYDQNGDGVIDAKDAGFAQLLVWQDANHDGVSNQGEMFSLTDLHIASINLNATETDYQINDNTITDSSTFTYDDGSTGQIVDAWFASGLIEDSSAAQSGTDGVADSFTFDTDNSTSETVQGYNADDGDVLDISALLENFDPLQDAIDDFVFSTTTDDGSTILSVDASGSGDASAAVQFAVLQGVSTSVDDLALKHAFVTA